MGDVVVHAGVGVGACVDLDVIDGRNASADNICVVAVGVSLCSHW